MVFANLVTNTMANTRRFIALLTLACAAWVFPDTAFACNSADTYSARQCINAVNRSGGGWRLVNGCSRQISAVWCVEGSRHNRCRSGSTWWSSSWTIAGGGSYTVPAQGGHRIRYTACRYTFWD